MTLSREDLQSLAARAASLYERLGPEYVPAAPVNGDAPSRDMFAEWIARVATGDEEHFHKRLTWDGLTQASAEALLSGVRLRDDTGVPGWADSLRDALDAAHALADRTHAARVAEAPFLAADDPIPFEHLFIPFVLSARRRLEARASRARGLCSDAARQRLERALLRTLSRSAGATLRIELATHVAVSEPVAGDGADAQYRTFVEDMYHGGLRTLLTQYPVLARILGRTTELWTAFIGDFLAHLAEDASDLDRTFGHGQPLGPVADVAIDLSDAHHGGRTVLRVRFASGTTCYYKPKNIDSDRAYNNLVSWLNGTTGLLPLRTVTILCKADHGWAEGVEPTPCADAHDAARYYERIGMQLCILYVLGANDCNMENIVSSGEHPVLIDTETLFHPLANAMQDDPWGASKVADQMVFYDSVFRVGMLPRWIPGPNGAKADISGLGGTDGDRGQYLRKTWHAINTDQMQYTWEWVPLKQRLVLIGDRPAFAQDYVREIERGFSAAYRVLQEHGASVLTVMGSEDVLGDLQLRFLVRNTHTYTGLIEHLLMPQHLTDGMAASIQTDMLARRFLYSDRKPFAWPIIPFESNALLQLDVPKFHCSPARDALRFPPYGTIDRFFAETGLDAAKRRLAALSASDLERQLAFIRSAFAVEQPRPDPRESARDDASEGPLTSAEALEEAVHLADQIKRAAIHGADGTITWITYGYQMDAQFWQVQPMGLSLYDGVAGPGLFLAAVERATGGDGLRPLALATFAMLAEISSREVQHWLLRDGLGAGLGTSSIIYALLRAGELLGEERLIAQAERIAALITPKHIDSDRRLDIVGGAAGCALVLTSLYHARRKPWIADLARQCGEHLLASSSVSDDGLRSWRTVHGKPLAGFSHGAAGIAYALCRLFALSGDARYRDAAAEACAYERSLFSAEERNWTNLLAPLKDGGFGCWNAWCHGAPGIGVGRLASLDALDTPAVREDIADSLHCADTFPFNPADHLCCGTLGRLETLLQAGMVLGDAHYTDRARTIAGQVVARARRRGSYAGSIQAGVLVPAFFQGVAGIGYQLLRIGGAQPLPSVLSYE